MTMTCINPSEIEEGALLAYLDGEAPGVVVRHVAQCPYCQAEAAALRQADVLLLGAYYRDECPDMDALLAYDADLLASAERAQVQDHLRNCEFCRAELAELSVPPTAVTPLSVRLAHLIEAGRQVLTAVLQPSPSKPALALRGEKEIKLTYQADDYQIVLVKVPAIGVDKHWLVEGQLLLMGTLHHQIEGEVILYLAGEQINQFAIDSLGYFSLDKLLPGDYTLELSLKDISLIVQEFTIP